MTTPNRVFLEFVHLPTYVRSARDLVDDEGQRAIEETLCANPKAGAPLTGTGGVRKLRFPLPGRGKRGGARLIYYYRERRGRIYLIFIYAKGVKEDLSQAERNEMRALTSFLEKET